MVDKEDVELLQRCGPSFENLRWWARSLDEVDSIDRPIVGSANMSSSGEMGTTNPSPNAVGEPNYSHRLTARKAVLRNRPHSPSVRSLANRCDG
jgi:hypothetical protein